MVAYAHVEPRLRPASSSRDGSPRCQALRRVLTRSITAAFAFAAAFALAPVCAIGPLYAASARADAPGPPGREATVGAAGAPGASGRAGNAGNGLLEATSLSLESSGSALRAGEGTLHAGNGLLVATSRILEAGEGALHARKGLLVATKRVLESSGVLESGKGVAEEGGTVSKSGEGVVGAGEEVVDGGESVVEEGKSVTSTGEGGSPTPSPEPTPPPASSEGKTAPVASSSPRSTSSKPGASTPVRHRASFAPASSGAPSSPSVTRSAPQSSTRASRHSPVGRSRPPSSAASSTPEGSFAGKAKPASSRKKTGSGKRSGKPKTERESPFTTTITKIVDVVPLPVRVAIGALLALALALGVRSWLAAVRAKRLEQQRGELLQDVGLLQRALLPTVPREIGSIATSVAYLPADGPGAGGDFYDVFPLAEGQVAVVVGDLSGHGREALQHTALMRFTLRAYLEANLNPRETLKTAGAVLEHQLGGALATVTIAIYRPTERTLTYSSAGHPPPLVLGPERGATAQRPFSVSVPAVMASASPLIGAGMETGLRETAISIPGAAQVCFYTDGVTDARVGAELFGEERLRRLLMELGPQARAQTLLDRIAEETNARPDDMAACVLTIAGAAQPPTVLCEQLEVEERLEGATARAERFLLACGVDRGAVDEVIAALEPRRRPGAGPTLLQVDLSSGARRVVLRPDEVTSLYAADSRSTIA